MQNQEYIRKQFDEAAKQIAIALQQFMQLFGRAALVMQEKQKAQHNKKNTGQSIQGKSDQPQATQNQPPSFRF